MLGGLLVGATLSASHTSGQTPAGKAEPDTATRLRELEARVAKLEKRLAGSAVVSEEIPFGEVVANLHEERLNRYLRMKIALKADEGVRLEVADAVTRRKAELKSWLLGYLADHSLGEVSGTKSFNRLRDAVRDEFGRRLFPGGQPNPIREVLFEEYFVQ